MALAVLAAVALVAARGAAPAHGALADLRATVQCAVENAASFSKRGPSVRIEAGDFSDYGCFCGLEGVAVAKSGTPVDAIDECCRAHHECWRAVDAAHGNAGGRVRECSLAPHFLSCDAGAEDASAAMKCYDFEAAASHEIGHALERAVNRAREGEGSTARACGSARPGSALRWTTS